MFTGIIEEVGTIRRLSPARGGARMTVAAAAVLTGMKAGDSIAVDGACLTVEAAGKGIFTCFLSEETLEKTTFSTAAGGKAVNLERALALGGRLGGHLVSGHVEAVGRVEEVRPAGDGCLLILSHPGSFASYLPPKGSVAVDGVSLTVAEAGRGSFTVAVIPETLARTTLRLKRPGDSVNLEPDLVLKYLEFLLKSRTREDTAAGVLRDRLKKAGFLD